MVLTDDDDVDRLWSLTVLKAQGLAYMNVGKKAWRPIVTVEVEGHHHTGSHETILGVDGQNTNVKLPFHLRGVDTSSKLELKVWQRSESKKKAKRRNLVASSSHRLGELLKKQEYEKVCEIRLICCQTQAKKRNVSSRGRPQNGAVLLLKVSPPSTYDSLKSCDPSDELNEQLSTPPRSPTSSGSSSDAAEWAMNDDLVLKDPLQQRRKLRRRKAYKMFSDEETCEEDCSDQTDEEHSNRCSQNTPRNEDSVDYDGSFCNEGSETTFIDIVRSDSSSCLNWTAASLLPQTHLKSHASTSAITLEDVDPRRQDTFDGASSIKSTMSMAERSVASFTVYHQLKLAEVDSEYEAVFHRLQTEWTYIGGLLVALAAVDAAVFAISPDTVFSVDGWAKLAVASSSIASGVGIAVDAWFLLRYNFTDLNTFIARARDVFDSYLFFSISARLPAIAMFMSALSLMCFLAIVAFEAWPNGVLVISCLFGVLLSLQFLAFGIHKLAQGIVWVLKGLAKLLRISRPSPQQSPQPA